MNAELIENGLIVVPKNMENKQLGMDALSYAGLTTKQNSRILTRKQRNVAPYVIFLTRDRIRGGQRPKGGGHFGCSVTNFLRRRRQNLATFGNFWEKLG